MLSKLLLRAVEAVGKVRDGCVRGVRRIWDTRPVRWMRNVWQNKAVLHPHLDRLSTASKTLAVDVIIAAEVVFEVAELARGHLPGAGFGGLLLALTLAVRFFGLGHRLHHLWHSLRRNMVEWGRAARGFALAVLLLLILCWPPGI
jgi:hypothetical protein